MEKLGKTIGELSVNTLLDKLRFFESTVFNYCIGNNDMHLKNYSMFLSDTGWVLSPFYDLINAKMILPKDKEDGPAAGAVKRKNFNKGYFDRFGSVLKLNDKQINAVNVIAKMVAGSDGTDRPLLPGTRTAKRL